MKTKIAALFLLSLGLARTASAVPFYLEAEVATLTGGTTNSGFYEVEGGVDSGSAASLYTPTSGGNNVAGYWVEISFGGNPQPILTSAFFRAGGGANSAYLWWDSTDLAAFN